MIAAVAEEIALSDFFLLVCRYSFTWCLFSTRLRYETLRTPFLLSFFFLELVNKPARQCQIASTSKRYERRRVSLGSAGSQAHVSTALSVKIRLQASNIQDSYGGHTGECITRDGWNGATDTTHVVLLQRLDVDSRKAGLKSVRLRINRNIKTDGLAGSGRKATLKDVRLRIQSTTETDGQGG
ncbi:uncharacterized protein ARMOST_11933 [Armillaria ostoyae]|uniref:Uncharacterized protein n=1 Tax=Armillaria ostoyae TaxID=47428 RepID=A0A284RIL4_ARMOS|nr:uncharacterized protein ARMOST_11933 [Armillaria ostoyae]